MGIHIMTPLYVMVLKRAAELTVFGSNSNRAISRDSVNWDTAHDAASGTILTNYDDPYYLIFAGTALTISFWIYRGFLFFDTSGIPPGVSIISATLSLYIDTMYAQNETYPYLQITQGVQHDPVVASDYGDQLPYTTVGGQARLDSLVEGEYGDIPFNAAGLGWINPTGITKLCLRGQMDVEDVPHTVVQNNLIYFYSAQKGNGYQPKLVVSYR